MFSEAKSKHMPQPTADLPTENKEHRIFINDQGEGTFICPACNKEDKYCK